MKYAKHQPTLHNIKRRKKYQVVLLHIGKTLKWLLLPFKTPANFKYATNDCLTVQSWRIFSALQKAEVVEEESVHKDDLKCI
jgi:hypothetical protein